MKLKIFSFLICSLLFVCAACGQSPSTSASQAPVETQPPAVKGPGNGTGFPRQADGTNQPARQGGTGLPGGQGGTSMPGRQAGTGFPGAQNGTNVPGRGPGAPGSGTPGAVRAGGSETPAQPTTTPSAPQAVTPSITGVSTAARSLPAWFGGEAKSLMFNLPTGMARQKDGTLWMTNLGDNRVYHLDASGKVLAWWGGTGVQQGEVRPETGLFNEPWGIAISPDGAVYVADTWNHRIQKFQTDGTLLLDWGRPGQGKEPYGLFGPRAVAVNSKGVVFVSDTGNHRVVAYSPVGKYIGETAGPGSQAGQMDEPIGLWLDESDKLFVVDSWNRRVQVFSFNDEGKFTFERSWVVDGWKTKALDYKPNLCGQNGKLYLTDPEQNRVLEYSSQGNLVNTYNIYSLGIFGKGRATGIACSGEGLWVSLMEANALVNIKPQPAP